MYDIRCAYETRNQWINNYVWTLKWYDVFLHVWIFVAVWKFFMYEYKSWCEVTSEGMKNADPSFFIRSYDEIHTMTLGVWIYRLISNHTFRRWHSYSDTPLFIQSCDDFMRPFHGISDPCSHYHGDTTWNTKSVERWEFYRNPLHNTRADLIAPPRHGDGEGRRVSRWDEMVSGEGGRW